jgi:5-methylcytosine-specific restriction endonuclease McrA
VRDATRRYRLGLSPEQIEAARAAYREWYRQNAERACAQSRAWYHANRGRALTNRRDWNLRNPDYARLWVEHNRDKHNAKKHRRRARERGAFVEDVDPAVVYRRDRGVCYLCRRPVPKVVGDPLSPALDHVQPLSRGGQHSYQNVRLTHHICNARKGVKVVMHHGIT